MMHTFGWIQIIIGMLLLSLWIIGGSINPNPKD